MLVDCHILKVWIVICFLGMVVDCHVFMKVRSWIVIYFFEDVVIDCHIFSWKYGCGNNLPVDS